MGGKGSKPISKQKMDRKIKKYFSELETDFQNSTLFHSILQSNRNIEDINNSNFLQNSALFSSIMKNNTSQRDFVLSNESKKLEESEVINEPLNSSTQKKTKSQKKAEKYNNKAMKKFKKQKYFEALKAYLKSFKYEKNSKYTTNIARCFLKLERPDASIRAMRISICISPYDDDLYRLAGIFAFRQFKVSQNIQDCYVSLDFFNNAFEVDPSVKNKHNYFLARKMVFLVKQKDTEDEKKELLNYLDLAGNSEETTNRSLLKPTYYSLKKQPYKFLFCPITLEFIENPVTTPIGNSYEKKEFLEWCENGGCKDPITNRMFYSTTQLAPNHHLKRYAGKFIRKHPWVFDSFTGGDDWRDFNFI
jgi:tetratricopeptide (TPR) repeat protein